MQPDREHGYAPIRDYAIIGDCHGAALVSLDGSVDWCAFSRFDAAPVFCRILDQRRGGAFQICPLDEFEVSRRYVPDTNILETTFRTARGKMRVTDFMPVGRRAEASVHDYVSLVSSGALVRIVEGLDGSVRTSVRFDPTLDYGAHRPKLMAMDSGITSSDGSQLRARLPFEIAGDSAVATITVASGDRHEMLVYPAMSRAPKQTADELLRITTAFWKEWSGYVRYSGEHRKAVVRSALALKLMTYAPSGAMVAAPTTSLPEAIGGERNWDYRYCWLRDSTLTLYALSVLGFSGEAGRFHDYLLTACHASYPKLQIMYGLDAEAELPERTLDHLEGYRQSVPVRIGNGAYDQSQHDVVGDVIAWGHLHAAVGGRLGRKTKQFLAELADRALDEWQEPDHGLWESRGAKKHYVYSKVMSWVALERAAVMTGSRRDKRRWRAAATDVFEAVSERGISGGSLIGAFGETGIDASLLRIPFTGFPLDESVFEKTAARVQEELAIGPFVYRNKGEDGFRGREGAFLLCSFWLVDALLWLNRKDEALASFKDLLAAANDLGLYSEEIDPASGAFLGNFPQAFTHLALVHTSSLFELAARKKSSVRAGYAENAKRLVGATAGPLALWNAFRQSGRLGRFRSSRDSMMAAE